MFQAKADFVKIRQGKNQTVVDYYEKYVAMKDVCDTLKVDVHDDSGAIAIVAN